MKLGQYKGLHARRPDIAVRESEIDKVLKNKQQENAIVYTIDDRPARMGDQAVLDFDTECEGKPVPHGKTRNYTLLLGSHTFVKGFEEAVAGHSAGDQFQISVTFPENYRIPSLQGKNIIYHVHLKALRLPEYQTIDNDFALDFSRYDTLEEWRTAIREELAERHEVSAYQKLTKNLLDQIIASSEIPVDADLKEELAEELYEDFLCDLEDAGMTFEKYRKRTGKDEAAVQAEKANEAEQMIRQQSVLHAIANKEHLKISDEDLAEEIASLAEEEGEDPGIFAEMLGDEEIESIADQLLLDLAMEFILEHVIWDSAQ